MGSAKVDFALVIPRVGTKSVKRAFTVDVSESTWSRGAQNRAQLSRLGLIRTLNFFTINGNAYS